MRNEKLIDFLDKLEEAGVNTNAYHWVTTSKNKKTCLKLLKNLFQELSSMDGIIKINRICSKAGCVNPFHYRPVQAIDLNLDPQQESEIEELTSLIDINELQVMGFDSYLEQFNRTNLLPAQPLDFFLACNRALNRVHKPLLDWTIYRRNYEDKWC